MINSAITWSSCDNYKFHLPQNLSHHTLSKSDLIGCLLSVAAAKYGDHGHRWWRTGQRRRASRVGSRSIADRRDRSRWTPETEREGEGGKGRERRKKERKRERERGREGGREGEKEKREGEQDWIWIWICKVQWGMLGLCLHNNCSSMCGKVWPSSDIETRKEQQAAIIDTGQVEKSTTNQLQLHLIKGASPNNTL